MILARIERCWTWTAAEKAALLAEIDAEGGRVRLVARRHRIAESVLYTWRTARRAAAAMHAPAETAFIWLRVLGEPEAVPSMALARPSGRIELTLPDGAHIKVDAAVDEAALARDLRAIKAAA